MNFLRRLLCPPPKSESSVDERTIAEHRQLQTTMREVTQELRQHQHDAITTRFRAPPPTSQERREQQGGP